MIFLLYMRETTCNPPDSFRYVKWPGIPSEDMVWYNEDNSLLEILLDDII